MWQNLRSTIVNGLGGCRRAAGEVWRGAVDFAYPPACASCHGDLPAEAASPTGFCESCWNGLSRTLDVPACSRCAATIGPHLNPDGCPMCRNEHYRFDRTFRFGVYDDELRVACLKMKHGGARRLIAGLGRAFLERHAASLNAEPLDLVVPVPRDWRQRFFDSHSSAAVLAEVWSRALKVPLAPDVLRKTRRTPPQSRLVPSVRRTNLKNAFAVRRGEDLTGATILLVDDVMTTGATANECSRALREAGATRVVAGVLARGLGRRELNT